MESIYIVNLPRAWLTWTGEGRAAGAAAGGRPRLAAGGGRGCGQAKVANVMPGAWLMGTDGRAGTSNPAAERSAV